MIRNVIFDWSGTLVDDLPAVLQATNWIFRQIGQEEFSLDRFRAEFRLPFKHFYDRYTPNVPPEQLEAWFHGRFRQVQDQVVALPHARDFLQCCRERQVQTLVLSTVHPEHFHLQAEATGFAPFLDRLYLGVHDKRLKIHELIQENGLRPDETLYIGDMEHDIETAKHGGVHSCAVLTGYTGLEHLRASGPDLIVEHLGELREILEGSRWNLGEHHGPSDLARPVPTVGALIFNSKDEVLMIRTHKWSNLWGIPGGKIKFGESSEDALRREIFEETALQAEEIQFVLVQDCIHSREFYRDAHFVLLNYRCRVQTDHPVVLNSEAQQFRWLPLSEALQLPLNEPTRVLLQAVHPQDAHE
jgi:phosphoglycolate phosphatase